MSLILQSCPQHFSGLFVQACWCFWFPKMCCGTTTPTDMTSLFQYSISNHRSWVKRITPGAKLILNACLKSLKDEGGNVFLPSLCRLYMYSIQIGKQHWIVCWIVMCWWFLLSFGNVKGSSNMTRGFLMLQTPCTIENDWRFLETPPEKRFTRWEKTAPPLCLFLGKRWTQHEPMKEIYCVKHFKSTQCRQNILKLGMWSCCKDFFYWFSIIL